MKIKLRMIFMYEVCERPPVTEPVHRRVNLVVSSEKEMKVSTRVNVT